jgi:hypothetical protein
MLDSKSNHAGLVHTHCGGPTMAKSFDEPECPNPVWTDLGLGSNNLCLYCFQPAIGVQPMAVNIKNVIDDAPCYDTVRQVRWPGRKATVSPGMLIDTEEYTIGG